VGRHRYSTHVKAPPEVVFDLWTNVERMPEWIGGVTDVVDVSGPVDVAGTRYTVMFGGKTKSPTEVLDAERPRRFVTHFGNWVLRGRNSATFEPENDGTRLAVTLDTEGIFPAVMAWIFSFGTWRGSFRGELQHFATLAEAEAVPSQVR
jgi:uncharacterized protein YndB with AHSA1/START domain